MSEKIKPEHLTRAAYVYMSGNPVGTKSVIIVRVYGDNMR